MPYASRMRYRFPVGLKGVLRSAPFLLTFLLAACVTETRLESYARPGVGDRDPHDGVVRAHKLPVQGIDVSHHQGRIDWDAVKRSGIDFAYIKVTEGGDHTDPRFAENWTGAARAGVPRGTYHFMYWCRPVHHQALFFVLNVPQDPTALPPALDLEWVTDSKTCRRKVPAEEARRMAKVLLDTMEAHTGKRPIIYTDINFYRDVLSNGEFSGYQFWVRSVASEPRKHYGDRPYLFWQFTATGRVPGIAGPVDRNAFVGSAADWSRWLRQNGLAPAGLASN